MISNLLFLRPKKQSSKGFTVVESLVVLGLLFVLTVLIASLARYHVGGGAAETERELTPSVPDSVSSILADPSEDRSPSLPTEEQDSASTAQPADSAP